MTTDSGDAKVKDILEAIRAQSWDDEAEADLLVHAILVQLNRVSDLNALLDKSGDRLAYNDRIVRAVRMIRGPKFGFSGHGIIQAIERRFDEDQKREIVRKMYDFSCLLRDALNIQSFITSGTLLGLIRENQFLPHDDDFDMAYVSAFMDRAKILAERRRLFDAVNAAPEFRIEERTGGRAAVFVTGEGVNFMFDLFVGFRRAEFFNEFPLKPNAMLFHDIAPVRTMPFYGQDVFVPNKPEKLLEVNYGEGWKHPDPSFRFNFGEHRAFYNFLINNKIQDEDASE